MNYSSINYLSIKAYLDLIVKIKVYIINENGSLKLAHFCISNAESMGRFPIHTCPTPLLTPQLTHWTRVSRIYSEFQLCIRWGELQGCSSFWGNPEITEKYEYFFTVPRTFVHDCFYYKQWKPYWMFIVLWRLLWKFWEDELILALSACWVKNHPLLT